MKKGLHFSSNYIWSYADERNALGSYLRLELFANKASLVPKELYGRFHLNLGATDFDFLEVGPSKTKESSLVLYADKYRIPVASIESD